MKQKAGLRREGLKDKIDKCSDEVVLSIGNAQLEHVKLSKQAVRPSQRVGESKEELDRFSHEFDCFDFDEKKFENIKKQVLALTMKLESVRVEFEKSLVDKEGFSFEFDEAPVGDFFGRFEESKSKKVEVFSTRF